MNKQGTSVQSLLQAATIHREGGSRGSQCNDNKGHCGEPYVTVTSQPETYSETKQEMCSLMSIEGVMLLLSAQTITM